MNRLAAACVLCAVLGPVPGRAATPPPEKAAPQERPHGARVKVPPAQIEVDDGDTVLIRWSATDLEKVRLLGIDAPETRHLPHDIPYAQPFGPEARAFAEGVFAAADSVEILRAATLDAYGRTLAYLFVGGRNYSILLLRARLAEETVSRFGDNGFAKEAAEVLAAARESRPVPFEAPWSYRARMRDVARKLKADGRYPEE